MKKNTFLKIALGLVVLLIFVYNFSSSEDYMEKIQKNRQEKDQYMRTSTQSPIKDKNNFKGLSYFEINEKYKVQANLEVFDNQEVIEMKMSKGEPETYTKYAWAVFNLEGKPLKLLALKKENLPQLFIAFTDETSGKTTYGGGRYLDISFKEGQKAITLDFNLAYHPYCVFNENYVCPIPPKDNRLNISILAGEKLLNL